MKLCGAVIWLLMIALWLGLFQLIGAFSWGYGPVGFVLMLSAVALLAQATAVVRRFQRSGGERVVLLISCVALAAFLIRLGAAFVTEIHVPRNLTWAIDIAANTYRAGESFLHGGNPYDDVGQVGARITPGPHIEVDRHGDHVRMFGVPYTYGYPYFPVMFLSYLPFRMLNGTMNAMRVGNLFLIALNLGLVIALTYRLTRNRLAAVLGGVAFAGVWAFPRELLGYAVTDILIAAYALTGFLLWTRQRPGAAGVAFGLAQACKLLPGPLLVLPLVVAAWGRPSVRRLLLGYFATALVCIVPFVLRHPATFLSSTILFYLTFHAEGDPTAMWFFLPELVQPVFSIVGYVATAAAIMSVRRWGEDVLAPLAASFCSYVLFIAFARMAHLNYLWAVYPLGCVALAAQLGRANTAMSSRWSTSPAS